MPSPVYGLLWSKKTVGSLGSGSAEFPEWSICPLLLIVWKFYSSGQERTKTKLPAAVWGPRHPEGASSRAEKMTVQIAVWPRTCQCLHLEKAMYLGGSCCQGFTLLHLGRGCLAYGPSHSQSFGFSQGKTSGAEAFAESTFRPRQARTQFYAGVFQAQSVTGKQSHLFWKAAAPPSHRPTPSLQRGVKPGRAPPRSKTAPALGARADDFRNVTSSGCAIFGLLQATVLTEQAVKQILSSAVTFVIVGHKPQAAWPGSRRETCVNIPMLAVILKMQPQLGSFPERMER